MNRKIAVVGSFRQHHAQIQSVCSLLRSAGAVVTSPVGSNILEEGIDFVRFTTDSADWSDAAIQSLALHRILRADLVYVVAPMGYIGRTTCYEVGRIVQLQRQIYFSERPMDLPIHIPVDFIFNERALLEKLSNACWSPCWLHAIDGDNVSILERELALQKYRND